MRPTDEAVFVAQVAGEAPPEVGFFTWDVPDNIVYADAALASLFGLDAHDASTGLAVEAYLDRVHPEDRSRLAKTIRDSIIANRPQQETYRVLNSASEYVVVTGFGRGFRDGNGNTVRYAGVVVAAGEEPRRSAMRH